MNPKEVIKWLWQRYNWGFDMVKKVTGIISVIGILTLVLGTEMRKKTILPIITIIIITGIIGIAWIVYDVMHIKTALIEKELKAEELKGKGKEQTEDEIT